MGLTEFPISMKKPSFQSSNDTMDEHGNVFTEISSTKKTVTDDRPVHLGVAILMLSKLLLFEFVFFIYDHVKKGAYRNVYCDTGISNTVYGTYNFDAFS